MFSNFINVAKEFESLYSFEVSKLRNGENVKQFEIDSSFFCGFENPLLSQGHVFVEAKIFRFRRYLDVTFKFSGFVELNCDRCLEPYNETLNFTKRLVYTYDLDDSEINVDDIVLIDENNPFLYVGKDLYDFIVLQTPLRRVPSEKIHICPEFVLHIVGEIESQEAEIGSNQEEETDPRWAVLEKLKKQQ